MKRIVNIFVLLIALIAVLTCVSGCKDKTPDPVYLDYTVTVVDGAGKPMSNVIVKFTTPDGETKTRVTEKDGIASLKNVIEGEYKVNIESGFSNAIINENEFVLTAECNSIKVLVRNSKDTVDLIGDEIEDGTFAYKISLGSNVAFTNGGKITYFVFAPKERGVYRFTLDAESSCKINYFGQADAVESKPQKTIVNDDKNFELVINNLAISYVIGISSDVDSKETLNIDRLRDAPVELYGAIEGDVAYAEEIREGTFQVDITDTLDTYFVFYASSSGVYRVSLTSDDQNMTVGFYGVPMFVQANHCGDGEYDGRTFELIIQDNHAPYVIGIKGTQISTAELRIERIGDAPFDPNYAEWVEVTANGPFSACDTTGKDLVDIDISVESFDLTLGSDGYYYTDDGKAVYIRLTTAPGHSYTDEEFKTQLVFGGSLALMAGLVEGQDVGNNIGGYVYDENGNFVNKYRYNQMLATYLEYVDGRYGVVQLNAELVECIKLHGQSSGWFNPDSYGYLFGNIEVNDEISWLFLCMVEA